MIERQKTSSIAVTLPLATLLYSYTIRQKTEDSLILRSPLLATGSHARQRRAAPLSLERANRLHYPPPLIILSMQRTATRLSAQICPWTMAAPPTPSSNPL